MALPRPVHPGPRPGPLAPDDPAAPLPGPRRLERAFRLCVARPPQSDERAALNQLLAENRTLFAAKPELALSLMQTKDDQPAPIEPAAWTAVARVLLNLDEFLTRE